MKILNTIKTKCIMGVDSSLPAIGEEELHVCHVNFPERQVVLLGKGDGEVINFVLQSPGWEEGMEWEVK